MNQKNILVNSTLLFVIATLWQQSLHESGHFVSAILLHATDISMHHNYVRHDTSTIPMSSQLLIASAEPLMSLFIGILFQLICRFFSKRNLLFLFFLFMSVFGYINFGGYLLISPFFKGGDTGFVFLQLGFPIWLTILFAIGGAVFLFYSMKMLCRYFVEMANAEIINDKVKRRLFINSLVKYPIYFGVVVTTLLNLPVVTLLSLIYPLFSPCTLFWGFGYMMETPYPVTNANREMNKLNTLSPIVIIGFVLTVICNRFLVHGIYW